MCKYEPKRKSACNKARANDYNNLCSGSQFENWELFSPKFFYSSGVCYRPVLSPSSSLEWEDRKYRPPEEDQQVFLIHLYTIWNQFRIASHCAAFCCTILSFPLSIICTYITTTNWEWSQAEWACRFHHWVLYHWLQYWLKQDNSSYAHI